MDNESQDVGTKRDGRKEKQGEKMMKMKIKETKRKKTHYHHHRSK